LLEGVGEAPVAGIAGEDDPSGAGGPGDGRGAGVVLACPGVSEPDGRVTELGQDPGTEDDAETGLAGVNLSIRVTAKKWAATTSPSSSIWALSALISATCAETMAA
jgi:hypothetical protein